MAKKMTRKEALVFAYDTILGIVDGDGYHLEEDNQKGVEALKVIDNMIEQIDKQAARPKAKSTARIENERMAREFIPMLRELGKPVSAKWMTEHIRYCGSSQKAVQVAKIAEEWGAIKRVTIKKRTYYEYDDTYRPLV